MDGGFEVTMNDGSIEYYNRFLGSIVWPHEAQPGIILLAGEKRVRLIPKMDKIIICEAREFKTTNEAAQIFDELWYRYHPLGYFHHYIENHGFTNQLWNINGMSDKANLLYLIDPEKPENIDCGIALIKDYLQAEDKILFQKEGTEIVSDQFKSFSLDDKAQQYKITALRYLLTGIHDNPWEPPYDDDYEKSPRSNSTTGY